MNFRDVWVQIQFFNIKNKREDIQEIKQIKVWDITKG